MEFSKEEIVSLQPGILRGINKRYCFFASFGCPDKDEEPGKCMKLFIQNFAKDHVKEEKDVPYKDELIYTLALGKSAFDRLRLPQPFQNDERNYAQYYMDRKTVEGGTFLTIGSDFNVLIQVWADNYEKGKNARAGIKEELKKAGLFNDSIYSEGEGARNNFGNERSRYLGPLGFVEGIGNPKGDDALSACVVKHDEVGLGTYMAFLNFRVDTDKFDSVSRELARKIFSLDKMEEVEPKHHEYAKAIFMGMFPDGSIDFASRGNLDGHHLEETSDVSFCPVLSHVKLMKSTISSSEKVDLRIVRRGITYKVEADKVGEKSTLSSGLYFISLQKSINDQFLPLLRAIKGKDLIVYRRPITNNEVANSTRDGGLIPSRSNRGEPVTVKEKDLQFVSFISEGYYFIPNKNFLTNLAEY